MTSRGISNDEIRRRAQVRTDKAEQRKVDALSSLKTQQTRRDSDQAKTLRLRALRLAREDAAVVVKAPGKKKAVVSSEGK
jgi:ABC-type bacteriocin/lantibiotic exporter with double-glycine peptidase domain